MQQAKPKRVCLLWAVMLYFFWSLLCCFDILLQSTSGYEDLTGLSCVVFAVLHQYHMGNYLRDIGGVNWKSTAEEQDFCLQSSLGVTAAPDL